MKESQRLTMGRILLLTLKWFCQLSPSDSTSRPTIWARPALPAWLRPRSRLRLKQKRSAIVGTIFAQALFIQNGDVAPVHADELAGAEIVQNAGKMLGRQVQARGNHVLTDFQAQFRPAYCFTCLQQITNHP